MVYGGGSKSPPDYTQQKNTIASNTAANYQQQANNWNMAAHDFNQGLFDARNEFYTLLGGTAPQGPAPTAAAPTPVYIPPTQEEIDAAVQRAAQQHHYEHRDFKQGRDNEYPTFNFPSARQNFLAQHRAQWEAQHGPVQGNQSWTAPDYGPQAGSPTMSLHNIGIANLWDDPNTAENENILRLLDPLAALHSQVSSLNLGYDRPIFDASVNSSYGVVPVSDIPSLIQANQTGQQQLLGEIDAWLNRLTGLQRERQAEEQRIRDFGLNLQGDLIGYGSTLGGLGVNDMDMLRQLEMDLDLYNLRRQGFSSSILDQMGGDVFSGADSLYNDLRGQLTGIYDQRQSMLDAADMWGQEYGSRIYDYFSGFDDNLFVDGDALGGARDQFQNFSRELMRYDPGVNAWDRSSYQNLLEDIDYFLSGQERQRSDALSQIASAQQDFSSRAQDLYRQASGASIYDRNYLDQLRDEFASLGLDIDNFTSPLEADFSGATRRFDDIESTLQDLFGRRDTELDRLQEMFYGASEGLGGLEAWDEAGFRERQGQLLDTQRRLSPFSGGRVTDLMTGLEGDLGFIDDALGVISDTRADLVSQAEGLYGDVQDFAYRSTEELDTHLSQVEALAASVDQWGAGMAQGQIDMIMHRLNQERNRIVQEREAVAARNREAQERARGGGAARSIDPYFYDQNYRSYASPEEEELERLLQQSAFLQNLGV